MKFYESHYDEYIESIKKYNLHDELQPFINKLPTNIFQMGNMIFFGPTGSGKYSQVLNILEKYSPSHLKYNKKIKIQTEKQDFIYHISDIHFEIDMSLLGCNSKLLWHEIFLQIVDIISIKNDKVGFIVCKNFHMIHTELLEIFYSYIQEFSGCLNHNSKNFCCNYPPITIHFIIITENISFIPNNILNSCQIINICKPENNKFKKLLEINTTKNSYYEIPDCASDNELNILGNIKEDEIINIKELYSFKFISNNKPLLDNNILSEEPKISKINKVNGNTIININDQSNNEIPKDIFNIVCDNVINEIINHNKIKFTNFRDIIYDILIYNLEVVECLWYILNYFIQNDYLKKKDISDILNQIYVFLKYYNNNYRPIYHLESILFYLITKIHGYELL